MNRKELKRTLDKEGISPRVYSLSGLAGSPAIDDDRLILDKAEKWRDEEWVVYYYERGQRRRVEYFETEDEACEALLNRLLEDPTTRLDFIKKHPIQ
jgi:hypothetical protein